MPIKTLHWYFWGTVLLWFIIIFFHQTTADEIEHMHIAWLMGYRGLMPIQDFFQHHTHILWDILALYYKFGGQGPEIIYYGRSLVLFCAVLTIAGFYVLGSYKVQNKNNIALPGMFGILIFIFASSLLLSMFSIRPETIGTTAFIWSVVFWMKRADSTTSRVYIYDLLAGLLFGLALISSPRFLLLGGVYLLFDKNRAQLFVKELLRLLTLGIGVISFISIFLKFSYFSLADFYYVISFSALLQSVGDGPSSVNADFVVFFTIALFILYLVFHLDKSKKEIPYQWSPKFGYLIILFVATAFIGGNYVYDQDLIPLILFICLMLAYFQPEIKNSSNLKELAQGLTIAVSVFALTHHQHLVIADNLIDEDVKRINLDLSIIPVGERILMNPRSHPISIDDASYYVLPLFDAQNRLCNAARLYPHSEKLPECNYWDDIIDNQPFLLTKNVKRIIPMERKKELKEFLGENYRKCNRFYVRLPFTEAECLAHESLVENGN